jgi:hypothetical protein
MGGGTQTSTSNTTSQPLAAAQPAIEQGLTGATNLASAGAFQPYMGSTVTPWSTQTNRGNYGIEQFARKNEGTGPLGAQYQDIINQGGYNEQQREALAPMQAVARGDYLNRQDPNFERALSAASESAANQVNLAASGAGRYGGADHLANALTKTVGDYEAGQRVNQYNTERDRQSQASQNLFNAGQQGFSNIGQAYQQAKAPWQDLREVGGYGEDLMTRLKNDEIRRFEAQQTAPRQNIEWLNAIASGAGSLGGTSTATAQQPGQSPFATALGYGTGLASLFGGG